MTLVFTFLTRRFRMRYWRSLGFTQLEVLVIVAIIAVMTTIAIPNLGGMLEAAKVKQAVVELRTAFQETQRQSIRSNQSCRVNISIPAWLESAVAVRGDCLASGDRKLPKRIGLATNLVPNTVTSSTDSSAQAPSSSFKDDVHKAGFLSDAFCYFFPSRCSSSNVRENQQNLEVEIGFSHFGSALFDIAVPTDTSTVSDYSAKFIAYRPQKKNAKKSCVAVSGSLGLTRIGTYQGDLDPLDITVEGQCQVNDWTKQ